MNQKISQLFPLLTGTFASLNEFINVIVEGMFADSPLMGFAILIAIHHVIGPGVGISATNAACCLRMLQSSVTDLKNTVYGIHICAVSNYVMIAIIISAIV